MGSWAKFRARILGTAGARFGSSTNYTNFSNTGAITQEGTATLRMGASPNYTTFSACGRATMAAKARARKDQWIDPNQFWVQGDNSSCTAGSMKAASATANITGSTFAGVSTSMMTIRYITPSAKVTGASTTGAFAQIAKPADADTTGSLTLFVEWCGGDTTQETSGSTVMLVAAMAYMGTGSAVRTGASAAACPSVATTSACIWFSSSLAKLPSWGVNDTWGILYVGACCDGGTLAASQLRIGGVRLRYTACALGVESSE